MTRMIIRPQDTIKARLFDKKGKIIASVYDSGFCTVSQVIDALKSRTINPHSLKNVAIYNMDRDFYNYYTLSGKKLRWI